MHRNVTIIGSIFIKLVLVLFLLSIAWVLIYRFLPPPATLHMFSRRAKAGKEEVTRPNIKYKYVSFDEVAPHVPLALMAAEDQLFPTHNGFDLKAMKGAFMQNRNSKRIAGGSTISQQVAKNVFLWHGRSYLRKGVEAYFTMLIELLWPKTRILEVYFNIAEMGDRVFGIAAASQVYFKKDPKDLTPNQAALIAAVLPNPVKYSVKKPTSYILARRRNIARNMRRLGGVAFLKKLADPEPEKLIKTK